MEVDWQQVSGVAVLAVGAAIAIVLVIAVLQLLRRLWRWILGSKVEAPRPKEQRPGARLEPHADGSVITASDLYAIRANIDAVSRQVADLEQKLRLSAIAKQRQRVGPQLNGGAEESAPGA